jgi:hypothetical protein
MPLFLSHLTDDDSAKKTAKISLAASPHVKMYRIWMFAMLKDRPTAAERQHIGECDACGGAFRASLGVSSFGKGPKDQPPDVSEPPASPGKDIPKAVA